MSFHVLILLLVNSFTLAQNSYPFVKCNSRNPKIIGGQDSKKHEFPFVVSLTRRRGHFCGASIIHERWLLSAGHCVCNGLNKFIKPTQIQGVLGLHSISNYLSDYINDDNGEESKPVQINFKNIVPHPEYICESTKNDIALLETEKAIIFSLHIQPTCLDLNPNTRYQENTWAVVCGWGWTDENQESGVRPDILQKANVKVFSNEECEKSYQQHGKSNSPLLDSQMCAGYFNGGIDSCWADSGGPLMSSDHVLIGIVSTGIGCARPGLPGIYTRVSKYTNWIQSVIQ